MKKSTRHILLKLDPVEDSEILEYLEKASFGSFPSLIKQIIKKYSKIEAMYDKAIENAIVGHAVPAMLQSTIKRSNSSPTPLNTSHTDDSDDFGPAILSSDKEVKLTQEQIEDKLNKLIGGF
jgi:hypothetical protein